MSRMTFFGFLFLLPLVTASAGAVVVVPLHPDLPDTLTEPELSALNLFPDQPGLLSAWFEKAAWGGVMAHLEIRLGQSQKNTERSIPRFRWLEMQKCGAALVAGNPTSFKDNPVSRDSSRVLKAWPEIPARNRKLPPELAAELDQQCPNVAGRWLVSGGLGYQHNITSYSEFFTDMVFFQLGFAHALTQNIMPYGGFTAGFGDLDPDYEDLVGDGHGSNYSVMGGLMFRAPVSRRTSLYVSGQGGYYRHSLQWGGVFEDPETGSLIQGHAREFGDWGYALQLGVQLQKSHKRKARFMDFNIGVMWGEVERWDDGSSDVRFTAEGDNAWLMLMFRFWDQI